MENEDLIGSIYCGQDKLGEAVKLIYDKDIIFNYHSGDNRRIVGLTQNDKGHITGFASKYVDKFNNLVDNPYIFNLSIIKGIQLKKRILNDEDCVVAIIW